MSAYSDLITAHANISAYYRLNESSGTTLTATVGPNGTIAASGVTYGVAGALVNDANTALSSDASSNLAVVNDDNALDLGDGPFSIEFWVKRGTATGANQYCVSKVTGAYAIFLAPGDNKFYATNFSGSFARAETAITDTTTWHHVVLTKNGSARAFYIDGVDVTAAGFTDRTLVDTTFTLRLGYHTTAGGDRLNGALDEVALYKAVLTADEVLQHYRTGKGAIALSDSVGSADSATRAPETTRADSVTATDADTKSAETTQADSVTATDATSNEPGLVQADSVTATDSQSSEPGIGLSDTATLSDALTAEGNITLGDSVTLTDDVSPDLLEALTKDLADSVTLDDNIDAAITLDLTQDLADSVTLQDFVTSHLETEGAGGQQPGGGGFGIVRVYADRPRKLHYGFADVLSLSDDFREQHTAYELTEQQREEELALLV